MRDGSKTHGVGVVLCMLALALGWTGCAPKGPVAPRAEMQLDLEPPALSAVEKKIAASEKVAIPAEPAPPASPEERGATTMLLDLKPPEILEVHEGDKPVPLPKEPRPEAS